MDAVEPTGQSAAKTDIQAVIFIGAGAISMMVAEARGTDLHVLDVLSQPIELARDVFSGGIIRRETMERSVQIILDYKALLAEYGESPRIRLLGSNVLMGLRSLDTVVNRLLNSCGLRMEVLDDGEMTRLLYINMKELLVKRPELEEKCVPVLHVGPGNTRLLLFDHGRITYYASYRMGAHRTGIAIGDSSLAGAEQECSLIREHIRGIVEQMHHDAEGTLSAAPEAMVVYGPDFHRIHAPVFARAETATPALNELVQDIAHLPQSQRTERYTEDYASVGALLPSVISFLAVAQEFEVPSLIFPQEEYSGAFLRSLLPSQRDNFALEQEVIHFSLLLANRYRVDRAHAQHVRKLAVSLFDQLQELHSLTRHDRLLLKVAAILHEVGTFINPKAHHRHGQYIILNSEIFGLSRRDVEVIGMLARYHRHGAPTIEDRSYAELDQPDRLRVQKLAALLRVGDAMERAHSHRISNFSVRFNGKRLELVVSGVHDLTIENLALRSKADLFAAIFGYDVQLVHD